MRPTRQPEQGRLGWAYVLDLTAIDPRSLASEVASLNNPRLVGITVTVRVGDTMPWDLDERVPYLLADALRAGVHLILEGQPEAVGAYWGQLDDRPRTNLTRRRHLEVVR